MKTWARLVAVAAALVLAVFGVMIRSGPAHAASPAMVSILHAVPGATVDVYVDGKALLTDFKPGTLTDPQQLPAGSYDLKVVAAGDGADGTAVAELNNAEVPAGANLTVVAHLDANGDPKLSAYANDVSSIPAGKARLIVRHDAAAPAVDVRANKTAVFTGLENPDEESAEVDAGTVSADVTLAGQDDTVIGPASLNLREGQVTIVYAWGSASDNNLKLAVQTISGMGSGPNGVPGGTGGQAASSPLTMGILLLAVLAAATAGVQLARRRVAVRR